MIRIVFAAVVIAGFTTSVRAAEPLREILDILVAAYPSQFAGHDGHELIWHDGTRMPVTDGREDKSFDELVDAPSILDQFAIPYPLGEEFRPPTLNEDPGRFRNEAFFRKMYGDCADVERNLQRVAWLPGRGGATVAATRINDVADKLAAVARDLETLPDDMTKYLVPTAGTYNCRAIAGTTRLSFHAFGAAIDISTKFGDYWIWFKGKDDTVPIAWRNRIPPEIVAAFERHGFIWGGRWYHFDTFHFEYRPELVALAKRKLSSR